MQLERELETYQENLPALAQHQGSYVLIQGENVVDLFGSYRDALRAGYEQFGLEPFMIKQILIPEPIHFIPRLADMHQTSGRSTRKLR